MSQTRTEASVTFVCDTPGCTDSLTLNFTAPMTESKAIALGMWLVVAGQRVTPEGIVVDTKNFCSTECLKKYIDPLVQEYVDSEDRVLERMHRSRFDQLQGEPGGPEEIGRA